MTNVKHFTIDELEEIEKQFHNNRDDFIELSKIEFDKIKKDLKIQSRLTKELCKPIRVPWGNHFYPNIVTHQKSTVRKEHPDFHLAKSGDYHAALRMAIDMLSVDSICNLKKIVGNRRVVFAPVCSIEASGLNQIPRAFAILLSDYIKSNVDLNIYQSNSVQRTGKKPSYRMKRQPVFTGKVIKNRDYILVDDHASMGATFANLKGYIESNGGRVIATTSISARVASLAIDSKAINKSKQNIAAKHFEKSLSGMIRQEFGYEFDYKKLTKSEFGYITQRIIEQRQLTKAKTSSSRCK